MSTAPSAAAYRRAFTIIWDGTAYICQFKIATDNANWYYMRTTALGGTWTNVYTSTNIATPCYENGKYIATQLGSKTVHTSTDGISWSSSSVTMTGDFGLVFSISVADLHHMASGERPNNANLIMTLNFTTLAWTESALGGTLYTVTATTPSLTVNSPTWVALGGETMQYSVGTTSTPSFSAATTPTYTRSGNVITATYAQATGTSGVHVQLKAATLNSGDVLSQISATLTSGTLQTINGKPSYSLAPGKVALFIPTQSGWLSANTGAISVRKVTANYTMTSNDDVVIIGANNLVITVPDATAVEQGRVYRIKAGDFTGGSIATQSSQTIDGTTPPTLNTLENLAIYSDGSNWLID